VRVVSTTARSGGGSAARLDSRLDAPAGSGAASRIRSADLGWTGALLGLLGAVVAARYVAFRAGLADPILIGLGFGLALAGVAAIGALGAARSGLPLARATPPLARRVAIGLAGGAALVGLALVGHAVAGLPQVPALIRGDAFVPGSVATIVVATGEEAVLRGVLFDRLSRGSGFWLAILITSLAFALMHVPFYGWRVVPLDLGVGIWLAGLRLASGGILAPSIAHAAADLATWWL